MIRLERHEGIVVLRDDLLPGGTKSILLKHVLDPNIKEYVYASPVYGGFQIALSQYVGKRATIFCAKRSLKHPNTITCLKAGAKVIEVPYGYLSVIQARAREYSLLTGAQLIPFGAKFPNSVEILSKRVKQIIIKLGREPKEIFCAVGSGLLFESILKATSKCRVVGVQIGANYLTLNKRGEILIYPKKFEFPSTIVAPFPSMPNYDLKAWETCLLRRSSNDVLFWNVL